MVPTSDTAFESTTMVPLFYENRERHYGENEATLVKGVHRPLNKTSPVKLGCIVNVL